MDFQQEFYLASRLRACGHFLYYQTGGKTGQQRILLTLLRRDSISQTELKDALKLSSGALSEILQKMVEGSLIKREKSCDDRRQVILELTSEGRALALRTKEHYGMTHKKMFECLNPEEKERLGELLEKLTEHLSCLKSDPAFAAGACPITRES